MTTLTSNPIKLKAACVDVRSDASGVILGAQANGSILIDIHFCTEEEIDLLIVALVNGKHHFVAQGKQS